ncbi:MAG: DUF4176 domain-containing protein [Muribaculaceae bacterium]|nr:DUF4176 domain-containing protein [Muribaculaceae bacterium]
MSAGPGRNKKNRGFVLSMSNVKDLLPLGSVVILSEGEHKIMITGVLQLDHNRDYDYVGVLWPEGHLGARHMFLFDHEDVAQIIFRGLECAERDEFVSRLEQWDREDRERKAKRRGFFGMLHSDR